MEYDSLVNAIMKVLQVYISEISLESTFVNDLGADSLDLVQILKIVEADLGILIDSVDISKIITVSDALNVVKEARAKQ